MYVYSLYDVSMHCTSKMSDCEIIEWRPHDEVAISRLRKVHGMYYLIVFEIFFARHRLVFVNSLSQTQHDEVA